MAERTAADVMTRDVITVRTSDSIQDVARLLSEKRISGVPVIDDKGALCGVVTEADLIVRVGGPHLPPHIELLGGVIYLENPLHMADKLRKAMALTAGEIMTQDVVTVTADIPLQEVVDLMVARKLNRVPVVESGQLVGIITRHDIIATMTTD